MRILEWREVAVPRQLGRVSEVRLRNLARRGREHYGRTLEEPGMLSEGDEGPYLLEAERKLGGR